MQDSPSPRNLDELAAAVKTLLSVAGLDTTDPLLIATPQRVAQTIHELFSGVGADPHEPLRKGDVVPLGTQLVALKDIEFRSVCAHHLLPFSGSVSVAYRPVERIVGIGSIIRALEILSTRPQLQESLTQQFADAMIVGAGASGALVIVEARHSCIADRGPREATSSLRTIAAAGDLASGSARNDALAQLS